MNNLFFWHFQRIGTFIFLFAWFSIWAQIIYTLNNNIIIFQILNLFNWWYDVKKKYIYICCYVDINPDIFYAWLFVYRYSLKYLREESNYTFIFQFQTALRENNRHPLICVLSWIYLLLFLLLNKMLKTWIFFGTLLCLLPKKKSISNRLLQLFLLLSLSFSLFWRFYDDLFLI